MRYLTATPSRETRAYEPPDYTIEEGVYIEPASELDETNRQYRREVAAMSQRFYDGIEPEEVYAARSGPVTVRRVGRE